MPTSRRRSTGSSTRAATSRRPCGSSGRFWRRPPPGSTGPSGGTSWPPGDRWSTSPRARWTMPTRVACSGRPSRPWPVTISWWWRPPAGPTPTPCAPRLPANVRVERFIPHDRLLPHVDVMVTNGGYGGVQQALAHGVPLVVAGDSEDKPEVAARVHWSGAGVDLRTGRPSPARWRRPSGASWPGPPTRRGPRPAGGDPVHPSPRHHRRGAPRRGRSAGRRPLAAGPVDHSAPEETGPRRGRGTRPPSGRVRW